MNEDIERELDYQDGEDVRQQIIAALRKERKDKIDKLWIEHRSLSYTCYCTKDWLCQYCSRQIEILKKIKELKL